MKEGLLRRCLRPAGRHHCVLALSRAVALGSNRRGFSPSKFLKTQKSPLKRRQFGGEGGIRTLDTLLTYTPLAGERLQPLGHFTVNFYSLVFLSFVIGAPRSRVAAKLSLLVSSRSPFGRPRLKSCQPLGHFTVNFYSLVFLSIAIML